MRTLYVQTFVLLFVICCLMLLQLTNNANTPLFGMLLTISGPALAALLTTQAVSAVNVNANANNSNVDKVNPYTTKDN